MPTNPSITTRINTLRSEIEDLRNQKAVLDKELVETMFIRDYIMSGFNESVLPTDSIETDDQGFSREEAQDGATKIYNKYYAEPDVTFEALIAEYEANQEEFQENFLTAIKKGIRSILQKQDQLESQIDANSDETKELANLQKST